MKGFLLLPAGVWLLLLVIAATRGAADGTQEAKFASAVAALPPQSLTLPQAEMMAAANHPQVGAAQARVRAAQQKVKQARAPFFPQVTANADAVGVQNANSQITATGNLAYSSMESRQSEGVSVSQLITDFGRTASLAASAKYRAAAAEADALTARAQVLLQVDQVYFEVLEARSVVQVADETVRERQLLLDQVEALAQGNFKSKLDVSFARVDVGEAKLLQLGAQNRLSESYARLADALGYQDELSFVLADAAPFAAPAPNLTPLLAHAFGFRPELAALSRVHEADLKFAAGQRAARYPTVQAFGAAGVNPIRGGTTIADNYAGAGINIGVPVLDGGSISAQISAAEAEAVESQRLLEGRRNDVARDVRTAWLRTVTGYKRIAVVKTLLDNATQSLELAKDRYATGISSIIELSQAQLNKTQAEIDMTTARYDYQILAANLKYQLGDFR